MCHFKYLQGRGCIDVQIFFKCVLILFVQWISILFSILLETESKTTLAHKFGDNMLKLWVKKIETPFPFWGIFPILPNIDVDKSSLSKCASMNDASISSPKIGIGFKLVTTTNDFPSWALAKVSLFVWIASQISYTSILTYSTNV